MTPQPPVTPSPFRFIAPKRQTQVQQQQQQQQQPGSTAWNRVRLSTPLQWRVRGQSPSNLREQGEGRRRDLYSEEDIEGDDDGGQIQVEGDGQEESSQAILRGGQSNTPIKSHPATPVQRGRSFAPIRKFNLPPSSTVHTPTPSKPINPRAFLISTTSNPPPRKLDIDIDDDEGENEELLHPLIRSNKSQKHTDEGTHDGVEDPESPVKKRRKVGETEDALNELADEDAIEDAGSESDGEASGIEELLVLDFIRRRNETNAQETTDLNVPNHESSPTRDSGQPWDPMDFENTVDITPLDLGRGKSPEPDAPSPPPIEASHPRTLFNTSTPLPKSKEPILPPSSTPSVSSHRKPPKFKLSTPLSNTAPAQSSLHPPSFRFQPTPTQAPPPEPEPFTDSPLGNTKPAKPASSYFRTILAPAHQQHPPLSPHRNRHSIISSDWSPSARRSRRKNREAGHASGKYVPNGLAETVLNWTLETLSTASRGEMFTSHRPNHLAGHAAGMDRKCLRITQIGGGSGVSAQEEGIAIKGVDVIIRGDPGIDGEERRFLLVVGKRGTMAGIVNGIEVGKEITYGMPWWDIDLTIPDSSTLPVEDAEIAAGDIQPPGSGVMHKGIKEREMYRVLVTWDICKE